MKVNIQQVTEWLQLSGEVEIDKQVVAAIMDRHAHDGRVFCGTIPLSPWTSSGRTVIGLVFRDRTP
jgi:hypothetical protein